MSLINRKKSKETRQPPPKKRKRDLWTDASQNQNDNINDDNDDGCSEYNQPSASRITIFKHTGSNVKVKNSSTPVMNRKRQHNNSSTVRSAMLFDDDEEMDHRQNIQIRNGNSNGNMASSSNNPPPVSLSSIQRDLPPSRSNSSDRRPITTNGFQFFADDTQRDLTFNESATCTANVSPGGCLFCMIVDYMLKFPQHPVCEKHLPFLNNTSHVHQQSSSHPPTIASGPFPFLRPSHYSSYLPFFYPPPYHHYPYGYYRRHSPNRRRSRSEQRRSRSQSQERQPAAISVPVQQHSVATVTNVNNENMPIMSDRTNTERAQAVEQRSVQIQVHESQKIHDSPEHLEVYDDGQESETHINQQQESASDAPLCSDTSAMQGSSEAFLTAPVVLNTSSVTSSNHSSGNVLNRATLQSSDEQHNSIITLNSQQIEQIPSTTTITGATVTVDAVLATDSIDVDVNFNDEISVKDPEDILKLMMFTNRPKPRFGHRTLNSNSTIITSPQQTKIIPTTNTKLVSHEETNLPSYLSTINEEQLPQIVVDDDASSMGSVIYLKTLSSPKENEVPVTTTTKESENNNNLPSSVITLTSSNDSLRNSQQITNASYSMPTESQLVFRMAANDTGFSQSQPNEISEPEQRVIIKCQEENDDILSYSQFTSDRSYHSLSIRSQQQRERKKQNTTYQIPNIGGTVYLITFVTCIFANEPVYVHTLYGDIVGYQTDIARVFYGIPYAQPPVGPLRWNNPVPVGRWDPKILNATQPAPACPQPKCNLPPTLCPKVLSEDCLYLNIFTPLTNTSSNDPLPVMIFITGGNFQFLSASILIYESERFANSTNVITVFIQYRLGVLGFFATGNKDTDIKGNYGILDQRLALAWIKANIHSFGGNPDQITLFGQSAGAQSTALHYISDDTQSFFRAAIIQSAPMSIPFRTYSEYISVNVLLSQQIRCQVGDILCLRSKTADEIIQAQTIVNNKITSLKILLFFEPWVPVIDHKVVFGQLTETINNVTFPLKPLMIGTVTEEALLFIYEGWTKPLSATLYGELLVGAFGRRALEVIERYPPDGFDDQRPILSVVATQWVFSCSTRLFLRKVLVKSNSPSYYYAFGFPLDFPGWANLTFCEGHVCHGGELAFIFMSAWDNFTDVGKVVSTQMANYWTNFAKTLNTNQPAAINVNWPQLNKTLPYMYFHQPPFNVDNNYLGKECDFWDSIGYKTLEKIHL
ncbi:unnamed protein product [Didymodactylos carnosus]|uniref:Carboxylesterase type B domain-containing protein n=1 Tax=Didymodactylos carnosus TaxID=1234261 RepID=A0A8S2DKF4_9BILA|nr:unnamed protein product [Didymodactylos carnosus]CAF3692721.1 unnamed protein product [Didymodactylos carnosus]